MKTPLAIIAAVFLMFSTVYAVEVPGEVEVGHIVRDAVDPRKEDIFINPMLFQSSETLTDAGMIKVVSLFAGIAAGLAFVTGVKGGGVS